MVAREESVDPTAINGGLLRRSDIATLQPELRDALKGLEPGQLSPIVKIPSGYAILKLLLQSEAGDIERTDRARLAAIKALGSVRLPADVDGRARHYPLWFGSPGRMAGTRTCRRSVSRTTNRFPCPWKGSRSS